MATHGTGTQNYFDGDDSFDDASWGAKTGAGTSNTSSVAPATAATNWTDGAGVYRGPSGSQTSEGWGLKSDGTYGYLNATGAVAHTTSTTTPDLKTRFYDRMYADKQNADGSGLNYGYLTGVAKDLGTDVYGIGNLFGYDRAKTDSWLAERGGPTAQAAQGTNTAGTNTQTAMPQLSFNLSSIQPAATWTVDPKTQTVAGNLETILNKDNPLITMARTRALQAQNANGTLNSSMATGAADTAMYDKALEIATPDAATYARAAEGNRDATNTFSRDANDFTRQGVMADFNLSANDWASQQAQLRNLQTLATQYGYDLSKLDRQQVYNLANIAAQGNATATRDALLNSFDKEAAATQTANAAKVADENRLYGARADFSTQLNQILTSTTLGETARKDAIASLMTNYNMIITQAAKSLGWNPDSWIIKGEAPVSTTPSEEAA